MKIAIMQPYIFPYIGYFQLMNCADRFVIYDDVNFISKGWINRNKILVNGAEHLFTIPLKKPSQNKLINQIQTSGLQKWKTGFLKTLKTNYSKAENFNEVENLLNGIFDLNEQLISDLALKSIKIISAYLGIKTKLIDSSAAYGNSHLKKEKRLIDICLIENSSRDGQGHDRIEYINPAGGVDLYSKETFSKHGIGLFFLKTKPVEYKQFNNSFVGNLSIIDVMMFNSKSRIKNFLSRFELL